MINFYLSGNLEHDRVIQALYAGCPERKKIITNFEYEPSEVAVIFGFFKKRLAASIPRGRVFAKQRSRNLDVIVLETGYIKRGGGIEHYYAAGFNGLNGRADFRNENMPSDRANLLEVELKPWSKNGDHILLVGQVPWDASVDHIEMVDWLNETVSKIKRYTDRPIIFRPHPLGKIPPIEGTTYSNSSLDDDVNNAHAIVTFSSNTGVDAILAGKPVFIDDDGSMVKKVAHRDLSFIENLLYPDRQQWLNDIAYSQWKLSEMSSGLTWDHLFRKEL